MFYILRRKDLGLGSTKAIKKLSQHEITLILNNKLPEFTDDDVVLRWGTTANLIEQPPTSTNIYICKVLNSCIAIHTVNNKSFFRKTLQLQAPHLIPKTWFNYENPEIIGKGEYVLKLNPNAAYEAKNRYGLEDGIPISASEFMNAWQSKCSAKQPQQ